MTRTSPALPQARGDSSAALIESLRGEPGPARIPLPEASRPLLDEDLQLTLYLLYELHYQGFAGVDRAWEWRPSLLEARVALEERYLAALAEVLPRTDAVSPEEVGDLLFEMAAADDGRSLSRYLETQGTAEQFLEFMIHRSAYQLKEADPHSWAIPRLRGEVKSALLEIQWDEYGSGRAERMHSRLFAKSMAALGLDSTYGAYLDRIPGSTLAGVNLITLFGLNARLRGALVGHLAMFEITSAIPNRRYGNALRRLNLASPAAVDFYDEHVEADSVHENIAAYDLGQGLARAEPELTGDIIFGARALLALEGMAGDAMLSAWERGESWLLGSAAYASAAR
jgi:hypothetical protein